jgi:hypothetical protein
MVTNIYAFNNSTSAYDLIKEFDLPNDGTNIRATEQYISSRPGYSYVGDTIDGNHVLGALSFTDIKRTVLITSAVIIQADQEDYNTQSYVYSGYAGRNYVKANNSTVVYGGSNCVGIYKVGSQVSAASMSPFSASFTATSTGTGTIANSSYIISVSPVVEYSGANGYELLHNGKETFKEVAINGGVEITANIPSGATGVRWTVSNGIGMMAYDQGILRGSVGPVTYTASSIDIDNMYEYDYGSGYIHVNDMSNPHICIHKNRSWAISGNKIYMSDKGNCRYVIFRDSPIKINSDYNIDKIFSCGGSLLASSSSRVAGEIWKIDTDSGNTPINITSQYGIVSDNMVSYDSKWYFMTSDGLVYYDGSALHKVSNGTAWMNEQILTFIETNTNICMYSYNDTIYNRNIIMASNGSARIIHIPVDGSIYYDSIPGTYNILNYNRENISFGGYKIYSSSGEEQDDGTGIDVSIMLKSIDDFEDNPSPNYKLTKISSNVWITENPSSNIEYTINYREWELGALSIVKTASYIHSITPYNGFITREHTVDTPESINLSNSLDMEITLPNSYGKKIKSVSLYFERLP